MPITAEGPLGLALDYGKTTLANCATFQSIAGAADADAAKSAIHEGGTEDEPEAGGDARAIIRYAEEADIEQISTTGFDVQGMLVLVIEYPVPTALASDTYSEQYKNAINKFGLIIKELTELAGARQAGYLNINRIGQGPIGKAFEEKNNGLEYFVGVWTLHYR